MDAIFKRVSVRDFSKKPVKKKVMKKLLKAAMAAPSAGNQQPWEFVIVDKPKLLKRLSECGPYTKPVAKAPVSIVMLMRTDDVRFPIMTQQDMGACAENILLEATELGLGSVWQGIYPIEDRMEYIVDLFELPEGVVPFAIISIGYPKKGTFPKQQNRYDKKRVSWNGYKVRKDEGEQNGDEPETPVDSEPDTVTASELGLAADNMTASEPGAAVDDAPTSEAASEVVTASEPGAAIDDAPALTGWRSASNAIL